MSYAEFKARFEAEHGSLEPEKPWWPSGPRQFKPPAELEGPVRTVIDGMSGTRHVVPRNPAGGDHPVMPERQPRRKKRRMTFWCEECVRRVGEKEARAGHSHDEKPRYLPPPVSRSQPRDLNSRHKPRKRRKQASQWQGMAGSVTPRSQ